MLKELDASYTAIEELPDSITQLKELVWLKLDGCKKLKKLPEPIGNMEGLRTFRASYTAIEQLPDSFGDLINLEILDLSFCKNLRYLPNSLWKLKLLQVLYLDKLEKMQFLEEPSASGTAIEEVSDSIGQLSRDDPALEKGQEISSGIHNAIRDSKMFIVVISDNYARSSWCLNELVEILSCKKTENQVVPVFYYVDPTDVRRQTGSFGDALDYHEKLYSPDMINEWKSALAQIGEVSGYHLKKHANEYESKIIQNIVEKVGRQVTNSALHLGEELFGIDSAVEEIYQKLRMESNDIRAIGICGMGGIGKTTTAKAFYNKYHTNFDICCFIQNVKQYSQGGNHLLPLLEQLVNALLGRKDYKVPDVDSGIRQLKRILRFKKALVVRDDLDQSSCSEFLARHCSLFSAGSRIVITTRDVNLLNQLKLDISEVDIYMVNKLGQTHSLELFSYHALGESTLFASLTATLRELSVSFVSYAGGLPLALKVLGSSLRGRTQDELFWKAKLEKVREIPENEILEILQLSFNELYDQTVKSIFLDIAFFFIGKHKYEAVEIFKSCNFFPEVGIKIQMERCLLTIDEKSKFQMHDLIQEMGRNIAKNTRLFLRGNAWEDLRNLEDLDKIEGLVLDLTQATNKQIDSQIFERLPKLRLLEILNVHDIKGHFRNSFQELRCIHWSYSTWTRIPSSFRPRNLISILMPFSNFKMLWDEDMHFASLKMINVEYSLNLKTTPNFENSKSIEWLYFRGCESLLKVHLSIRELTGLYVLAESTGQSSELCYLYLGHCSNLRQLPEQLGGTKWLKELDASHTAIEELPDSITQLKELVYLKLDGCKKLRKLPDQIGNMEGLTTFLASGTAIKQLPDSFVDLVNLELLDSKFLFFETVLKHFYPLTKAASPKIADWLSYKSSGHAVSFEIPPLLGDSLLGLAISVILTCKNHNRSFDIKASVTNQTNGTTKGDEISIRSGDRIKISLRRQLYCLDRVEEVAYEGVKVASAV
ncbi:hypothetical protein AgCh_014842 [Apium graveolens]